MTTQTMRNGINVTQLIDTIEVIKKQPDLAKFQFRAHTSWGGGGRCHTQIQSFFGAGQEDTSRNQPHELVGDEPAVLLGTDAGPNAVEAILHALTSCLTVGFVYNAAARGINIRALDFDIEGGLDLQAFLGLSEAVRPGYDGIKLTYRVQADAPREKLEELCDYVQKTSPVLDILRNPVPVTIEMAS